MPDANLFSQWSAAQVLVRNANAQVPKLPNDATKFLDGTADWSIPPGSGGGTIEGTLNVVQKGDGAGNAIDSSIEDNDTDHAVYFALGDLGSGPVRVFAIKRLNADDVQLLGQNGADILILSGDGGSLTVQTDGGLGDDVILRSGSGGAPTLKIKSDGISLENAVLETNSKDIAGKLTLVAGTIRYDFVHPIPGGDRAIVVISPTTAPLGILSVLADGTGFDINSSNIADVVEVNYICIMAPIPA